MKFAACWKQLVGMGVLTVMASIAPVYAGDVIAEISVRNTVRPSTFHGEVFMFSSEVRDYSPRSFYGWSFRNRLPSGATRVLEVARARTSGAYLFATDLFANGLFSTMSHTVLMIFPRSPAGRANLYALRENRAGNLELLAPDGSTILVDGASGAVLPSASFTVAPLGAPGTPPGLRHRGLHLEIRSVGRSPFLRNTPVRVVDAFGGSCELTTNDLFLFGKGAESDIFRFDSDAPFFRYLETRCPRIRLPETDWRTASVEVVSAQRPTQPAVTEQSVERGKREKSFWHGGLFDSFSQLFSR